MRLVYTIISLCFFTTLKADQLSGVDIDITKSNKGEWSASFTTKTPVHKLGFHRNPDNSRLTRWHPIKNSFQLTYENEKEYIMRKDGKAFSEVSTQLTPTYKHLPKDYAPFSPFSNGGMLFHSARFYACINDCNESIGAWNLSLNIPVDETIVLNGKIYENTISWVGNERGQNVYVGSQQPIETSRFISVIDQGLPSEIINSLNLDIPQISSYFSKKLGELKHHTKPMLFASYAKVNGSEIQGGKLPNQVFIHWNINNIDKKVKEVNFMNDNLWVFVHEIAHFYQVGKNGSLNHLPNDSWIHEGNADFLASLYFLENSLELKSYVDSRYRLAEEKCKKALDKTTLNDAANNGQFKAYYNCGMIIHRAIDYMAKKKSNSKNDIFTIWSEYKSNVDLGKSANQKHFLEVVAKHSGKEIANKIQNLISADSIDSSILVDDLIGLYQGVN